MYCIYQAFAKLKMSDNQDGLQDGITFLAITLLMGIIEDQLADL